MSGEDSQPGDDEVPGSVHLAIDWPAKNSRPVTSSLPQELFVQIIKEVYWLLRREFQKSFDWWGTNWSGTYQLVCRSWRDVIRSTPWFWGLAIRVSRRPEWLEICLERCAGSWAIVYVIPPYDSSATFATLRRYASSIAVCHIHSYGESSWLEGLSSLLATPLPLLESLTINAPYNEIADVSFTHDLLPELSILLLTNCTPPQDLAVYASLRSLGLTGSPWQISYTDFLDMLRQCRNLEYLALEGTLLDNFHEMVMDPALLPPSRRPPVDFPSLKTLRLKGPREVLFDLVDTLHMPLATEITTETFVEDAHPGPHVSQLIVPDIQARHPLMCRPDVVSITCLDGAFRLSLRPAGGKFNEGLSLDVFCTNTRWSIWNAHLEPNIVATIETFSFDMVDTLSVGGVLEEVRVDVWQRAFQVCRNLRVLHLFGRGTLHSVWQGLSRVIIPSSRADESGRAHCSLLAEVVVEGHNGSFTATPTLFNLVRDTLRARADHCGARLKKLTMNLRYDDELWEDAGDHDAAVEEIRELVEEFDYGRLDGVLSHLEQIV